MNRSHPWIAIARTVALPGGRSGWIAVLGAEGLRALRRRGHAAVAAHCAPGADPSDVRFLDESAQAVIRRADEDGLQRLHSEPPPDRPLLTGEGALPAGIELQLRVQPDLRCLHGHFPDLPLVPGAMLLGWAVQFAAERLGGGGGAEEMPSVKFQRIVQPGHALRLSLAREAGFVRFEYASPAGRHASGRFRA